MKVKSTDKVLYRILWGEGGVEVGNVRGSRCPLGILHIKEKLPGDQTVSTGQ